MIRGLLTWSFVLVLACASVAVFPATPLLRSSPVLAGEDLAAQSIANALNRAFPAADINFLLVDAESGNVIAARWPGSDVPIAVGSLVKPFMAYAWLETHGEASANRSPRYPVFYCRGHAGGCWLPRGHGRIGMKEAIALSCNAYFRALVSGLDAGETGRVVESFGVTPPPAGASRDSLFGIGDEWRIAPLPLARAYVELLSRARVQGVDEIREGMSMAVKQGTAAAAAGTYTTQLLGKTGTAPCSHAQKAPGDGLAMLLYPASRPRLALLVRAHGHPGSQAAATGGRIFQMVISGEAGGHE